MTRLTASNLVSAISRLDKDVAYEYPNETTSTKVLIDSITPPEGPIYIRRYDPSKGETPASKKKQSISVSQIWRVANAISQNKPFNIDRILGASYNTRSAFEALLAHTPEFYYCFPGRIELVNSTSTVKTGHKHLLWCPDDPHELGLMRKKDTELVISEISSEAVYEAIRLPASYTQNEIDINLQRRHAQIQVALVLIGQQLGFRSWVAQNDKSIVYQNQRIEEMQSVVSSLNNEAMIKSFENAANAARMIDCIWFKNCRFMPAVMEIEHSTGVTSGLTRMKNFYDHIPRFEGVRWVIVAADEEREKVLREANKPQFTDLNTLFFPYSAVEELFSLCQRRKIIGVNDNFLDCFMEQCIS